MKIIVPPELLRDPSVLNLASICRELGASRYPRYQGTKSTAYGFDYAGEKDLTTADWEAVFALAPYGLTIEASNFASPVVPRTTLDNKVPSDWEGAYTTDDIIEIQPVDTLVWSEEDMDYIHTTVDTPVVVGQSEPRTKEWQEYTRVWDYGAENCRIEYRGPRDDSGNYKATDHEQLMQFIEKFGGYCSASELEQWRLEHEIAEI